MKNVRKEKREGKKSPWGVFWTDSEGNRRSKFFRTKELRDTYASDLEGTLNKHGASALDVDLDLWRKYCDLQAKLGDTPIEHAVDHYLKHAAPKESKTVNEAKAAFYENRQQAGCVDDYLRHVEKELGRFAKRFGERKLTDISVEEISTWIYALPYQNVTKRNYHTRLHAMWEYAILREWASSNPVHKVPKPKVKRKEPTTYTVEETEKILNKAWETDRSLVPYLALALFAGMRSSALDRLEFNEVDFDEKFILVPEEKAKNEQRAIIQHLPENLWLWLKGSKRADYQIEIRDYYERRKRVLLRR
jgi:integrase